MAILPARMSTRGDRGMFMSSLWSGGLIALAGLSALLMPRPAQVQIYETVTLATPNGSYRYVFPVAPTWLGYPYNWCCFNAYTAWAAPAYYGLGPYVGVANGVPGYRGPAGYTVWNPSPVVPETTQRSGAAASLDIRVPEGAKVTIDGRALEQSGRKRQFVTSVEPNRTVRYRVSATWTEDGRKISTSRDVAAQAGDRQSILFLAGSPAADDSQRASRLR